MNFRITTLVDNSVGLRANKLIGEHGLSFFIETENCRTLFDTGQHLALCHNAAVLGIDLSRVDAVVLSHGHYDHSGGLTQLIEKNTTFTLYAHPDVFDDKLRSAEKQHKKIGIPMPKSVLENAGVRLSLAENSSEIAACINTSGEIPLENDFESVESDFFVQREGRIFPDPLCDDQALILDTAKGLVVLLGCSHRGVINTLSHAVKLTGQKNIHAVIGGLHLGKASTQKIDTVIDHLDQFNIEKIGVSHCTGIKAMLALFNRFQERVFVNVVGAVMRF